MNETMYEALTLIIRLVVLLIVSILIPRLQSMLKDKQVNEAAQKAVYTVQQLYWDKPGKERKEHALNIATEALNKIGIKVDSAHLAGLIEAAVMEMNIAKGKYSEVTK